MTLNMFEKFPLGYQVLTLMKDCSKNSDFDGSLALNKINDEIYAPFYNGTNPIECFKFSDLMSEDNPFIENIELGDFYSSRDWRSIFKYCGFNPTTVETILCINHELNTNSRTVIDNGNGKTSISEVLSMARSVVLSGQKGLLVSCHYTGYEASPTNIGIYIGGAVFLTLEDGLYKLYEVDQFAQIKNEITHHHIMDLFVFAIAVGMYYSTSDYTADMECGQYSFNDYKSCGDYYMEKALEKNNHSLAQCYIGYLYSELRDPTPTDSQGYNEFHADVAKVFLKDVQTNSGLIALADAKKTILHTDSGDLSNEVKTLISQMSWGKISKQIGFEPKIHQPVLFLEGNYFHGVNIPNSPEVIASTIGAILKQHTINGVSGVLGVGGIMGTRFGEPVLSFEEKYFFISIEEQNVVVDIASNLDFTDKVRLSNSAFGAKAEHKGLLMIISQIIPSLHLYNNDSIDHFECVITKGLEIEED